MPALSLDPATLPPQERDELLALLALLAPLDAPTILAEPETRSVGLGWMALALLGAGGLAALLFGARLGVITSPWASQGPWIALPYALATMTLAIGAFKAFVTVGQGRLPWKRGCFLVAQGFLDTRRRPIRFRPIAEFTRVEIEERPGQNTPASFFTITVHFGDEREVFYLFCAPAQVPRAALDELALHRDAAFDDQRSEGGYRFARRGELRAPAPAPRRFRLVDHPVKIAALAGLLLVVPIHAALLPLLSLRAAERENTIFALRAAARAYPYAWVEERCRPLIHARFELGRARVATRMTPALRPAFTRLLTYLEEHERKVVYLRLVTPDEPQLAAATRLLKERVSDFPGATAAPIVLPDHELGSSDPRAGELALALGLSRTLSSVLPRDVLSLERVPSHPDAEAPDPQDPVLEITSTLQPTSFFRGESARVYAALTFSFETALLVPGEARISLLPAIAIAPPEELAVSRSTLRKEKLVPLGAAVFEGLDRIEDAQIYTQQARAAAETAATRIGEALLLP
jgi:hypothetical protein